MENRRTYQIDLYEVKIGSRIGKVTIQYFKDENLYFCKFINDKQSDFLNTFESFGFIVDKTRDLTKIAVAGKFDKNEAINIWDQIERSEKPIETTFIYIDN